VKSLLIYPPVLAVATQEPLFAHNVSFTAAIATIFLLGGIKIVVGTPITGFIVINIDPAISLAVPALLLLGSRSGSGHFL